MKNSDKELLIRRNKGKLYLKQYLVEINQFSQRVVEDDLLSLEETINLSNISFTEPKKILSFDEIHKAKNFIEYFIQTISNEKSYLFTSYTKYCGASLIILYDFLKNFEKVKNLKSSIASILSFDKKNEMLIEFLDDSNSLLMIEINGERWKKIANLYVSM